jgi:adenine/guanine phosphoribosyltransferase-like PRPP-binding protein
LGINDNSSEANYVEFFKNNDWLKPAIKIEREAHLDNVIKAKISPNNYMIVDNMLNTKYLAEGFSGGHESSGFYSGDIHLLSGDVVKKYFSFAKNTSDNDENFERWLSSAMCASQCIRNIETSEDIEFALLGFSGTVENIVRNLHHQLPYVRRSHILRTFDLPTIQEIRQIINRGDKVILVTDVISTGSTTKMLGELIRKIGGEIKGIVAAVDARRGNAYGSEIFQLASGAVPFFSCSKFEAQKEIKVEQKDIMDSAFWVDPVSLVPLREKPHLWDIPENIRNRIESTIKHINSSNSAKCGHIIDGTRHTSIYIDLNKLLASSLPSFRDKIRNQFEEVIRKRGWSDFNPSHVLFPTGISRLETVDKKIVEEKMREKFNITIYGTSVIRYVEYLKRIWPECLEIKVLRSFDPGGNSRCAKVSEAIKESERNVEDVIIADDGIWTGRTINSLIRSAVEAGARRIFVAPLLSRLNITEVISWESISSYSFDEQESEVPVCIYFPMIYPVPAYGPQDCPFEGTIRRLQERTDLSAPLKAVKEKMVDSLKGKTVSAVEERPPAFTTNWMELRCYLELAHESESELERVVNIIENEGGDEYLESVLELILSEWSLTGRARIRQSIAPKIEKLAIKVFEDTNASSKLKILSASVLRSLFPLDFSKLVGETAHLVVEDINLLERALLHVSTLDHRLLSEESCIRFLKIVSELRRHEIGLDEINHEDHLRYTQMISTAKKILYKITLTSHEDMLVDTSSPIKSAKWLYKLMLKDDVVQHELRPTINQLDVGRDNLRNCTEKVWSAYYTKFRENDSQLQKILLEGINQHVIFLSDLLTRAITPRHKYISPETEYIISADGSSFKFDEDVFALLTGLNWLRDGENILNAVDGVGDCASRIWSHILGERRIIEEAITSGDLDNYRTEKDMPTLGLILLELRKYKVKDYIEFVQTHASYIWSARHIDVDLSIAEIDGVFSEMHVFLPPDLIEQATNHILQNIATHAFPYRGTTASNNKIFVDILYDRELDEKDEVTFIFKDNSSVTSAVMPQGYAGRDLNTSLQLFGGQFFAPNLCDDQSWTVEQSFKVQVWE